MSGDPGLVGFSKTNFIVSNFEIVSAGSFFPFYGLKKLTSNLKCPEDIICWKSPNVDVLCPLIVLSIRHTVSPTHILLLLTFAEIEKSELGYPTTLMVWGSDMWLPQLFSQLALLYKYLVYYIYD